MPFTYLYGVGEDGMNDSIKKQFVNLLWDDKLGKYQ